MTTSTFDSNGITTTVASRTRRTVILQAQYKAAIARANPEITAYEVELAGVPRPAVPVDIDLEKLAPAALERYYGLLAEYNAKIDVVKAKHPIGHPKSVAADNTSYLISRVTDIRKAPFSISDTKPVPTFREEEVLKAYDFWLDGTPNSEGWWTDLYNEIKKLDLPLTTPAEAPPDTLTEDEKRDPLSNADAKNSSDGQKSVLEILRENELGA